MNLSRNRPRISVIRDQKNAQGTGALSSPTPVLDASPTSEPPLYVPEDTAGEMPSPATKTLAQMIHGLLVPVQAGLVLFAVANPDLKPFIFSCLIEHCEGQAEAPTIPFRARGKRITYAHNGSAAGLQVIRLLASTKAFPNGMECDAIRCSENAGFVWHTHEGRHAMQVFTDGLEKGTLILGQDCPGAVSAEMALGFRQIDDEARHNGVVVALVLAFSDKHNKTDRLSECCSEYVTVVTCEPDVGQNSAFAFDCHGHRQLGRMAPRKMMHSVKLDQDRISFCVEPFISPLLEERIIWMMRAQGKTFEEIGLALRKNKTTILRRFQSVDGPDMGDVDDAWLDAKLAAFFEVRKT